MKTFTFEEFTGYEFNCEVATAPLGFKHVCSIFKDGEEVANTSIQYGNRTWEEFQFASVLSKAKDLLEDKLNPEVKPELDTDFLNTLANYEYIRDYGILHNTDDEYVIIMDSWEQAEGVKREWVEGEGYVECELKPSVYQKLYSLAEQGRLKPSINYTMLNVEYVFSDEYSMCDRCGKVANLYYGQIRYVNELDELICETCATEDDDVLEAVIKTAKEEFERAVAPEYDDEKIEALGYTKLNEDSYSLSQEMYGEVRYGCDYIETDFAKELCEAFGGFPKLDAVQQFDTLYSIYIPNENIELAKASLNEGSIVLGNEE